MDVYAVTHIGMVREENQDSISVSGSVPPFYAVVADGMGGHNGGRIASAMAVKLADASLGECRPETVSDGALEEIIDGISRDIFIEASKDEQLWNMGTTIVLAIVSENELTVANVGDSRAYLLSGRKLTQITKDHSYVQTLIDKGALTAKEAERHPLRNVITRVVGTLTVRADVFHVPLKVGDVILLCSDGLTKHVSDGELKRALRSKKPAAVTGEKLLSMALNRGGKDNISIIIIKNTGDEP